MLRLFQPVQESPISLSRFDGHPRLKVLLPYLQALRQHLSDWDEEQKNLQNKKDKLLTIKNKKAEDLNIDEMVAVLCEKYDHQVDTITQQLDLLTKKNIILSQLLKDMDKLIEHFNRSTSSIMDESDDRNEVLQLTQKLLSLVSAIRNSELIKVLSIPRNKKRQEFNEVLDGAGIATGIGIAFFAPLSIPASIITVGSLLCASQLGKQLNDLTPQSARLILDLEQVLTTINKDMLEEQQNEVTVTYQYNQF